MDVENDNEKRQSSDLEGQAIENNELQKKFDEENMVCAFDKIAKKNKGTEQKSLILSDKEAAEIRKKKLDMKRQQLKQTEDEQDILGSNSRSVQSWSNVPRFHMERI